MRMAEGVRKEEGVKEGEDLEVVAMSWRPAARNWARAIAGERPRRRGIRRADPAEARMALADQGSAVPLVVTTPVAPKASAERMAAPTLPGSWTPKRATMRGRPRVRSSRVYSRGLTRAAMPWGCSVAEIWLKSFSVVRRMWRDLRPAEGREARNLSAAGEARHSVM